MLSMAGLAERIRALLPALWLGALLAVALVATPAAFATLAVADAGRVVARVLAHEAWISLGLAVVLLLIERQQAPRGRGRPGASVLSTELLLVLGAVFCTVLGYFVIQPMMPAARLGQGPFSFGQLHLASTLCFGLKLLVVAALAWRVGAPLSPPTAS